MIHTNYLERLLDPTRLKREVEIAIDILRNVDYAAIAVSGSSGLIFGGALSVATGKPILLVRKQSEVSHSRYTPVEGDTQAHRYLFVDDQVSSGDTRRRVRRAIEHFNRHTVFVGTYLYNNGKFYSEDQERSYNKSAPDPAYDYDEWGDGTLKKTTSRRIPPEQFYPPVPVLTPLDLFEDDLTVIKEPSNGPTPSELYNNAAMSRGG